jgi:hypothetical protein
MGAVALKGLDVPVRLFKIVVETESSEVTASADALPG